MAASQVVLQWGKHFTVRSVKAEARRKEAENVILEKKATFALSGGKPEEFALPGIDFEITEIKTDDGKTKLDVAGMPVFYDQTTYNFTISLPEDTTDAYVFSMLSRWCEDSEWNEKSKELRVPINFGNDLGDFELCWRWLDGSGEVHSGFFRGQVFSTKLDVRTHFEYMLEHAKKYDWINLDLLKQTTWAFKDDVSIEATQQTWLLIFQQEYETLSSGFRNLISNHRKRLQEFERFIAADRIRKMDARLEERVGEGLSEMRDRKYRVESRVLDADIPENRLMKSLLRQTLSKLRLILDRISGITRFSDVFKQDLEARAVELEQIISHRFWRGICDFHGMRGESLVLSQDPRYASIRRSWFRLQHGLKFFENGLNGGIQNVAQLYEIWCLLKLDVVLENMDWKAVEKAKQFLRVEEDDWELEEARSGSMLWRYKREAQPLVELELLFQPTAGNKPSGNGLWDDIVSIPIVQKPDIVLRLRRNDLPLQPVYTWIFDAKYRIDKKEAPPDAVNQMHQYRDAILWQKDGAGTQRERESIGAYVLYPGTQTDAQYEGISKTNIGSIPLIPTPDLKDASKPLEKILEGLLDVKDDFLGVMESEERIYHAVPDYRKRTRGNIVFVTTRTGEERTKKYWEACRLYRVPVKEAEKSTIPVQLWHYLIPRTNTKDQKMFSVKSLHGPLSRAEVVRLYKENRIKIDEDPKKAGKRYYVFELHQSEMTPPELGDRRLKGKVFEFIQRDDETELESGSNSERSYMMVAEG